MAPMTTTFDLSETDRLLTTTRAVRRRLDLSRAVEPDVVLECLRIAVQAPSGGNTQRWRWVVVDDADLRHGLADIYRKAFEPYIAMQKAANEAAGIEADNAIVRSATYLSEHLHEVPVHVIPCLLDRLPERPSAADAAGYYGSIVPAVWSFMLALRSRGLGSAFTTLHLVHEREAGELLGIPDTVTQIALIPVAYASGEDFRPAPRRPVEEVTYRNAWRRRFGEISA
jgi:nitroreductase